MSELSDYVKELDDWIGSKPKSYKGMNVISIRAPRWKDRTVGIADFRIQEHNLIEVEYVKKDGTKLYPGQYYVSGNKARSYPTQVVGGGVTLHLMPLRDLERIPL